MVFPTRIAMAGPLPGFPDTLAATGTVLRICQLRLGHQPALAGIKHLNRLENVVARMEWAEADADEGVLLDTDGKVISGVMSNLFIRRSGIWRTPALEFCGVAGVTRGRLMHRLGAEAAPLSLDDLLGADTVLLCNSLIRVRWASRLEDRRWNRPEDFESIMECLCSEE